MIGLGRPEASAAALLLFASLAGCNSTTGRMTPQRSTLVFTGLGGEPATLNPILSNLADELDFTHLYMSYLVENDEHGNAVPELALQVPTLANGGISRDQRTITYHLRRNLRWQDGASLTARDVVFSYHAIMNPRNDVPTRVGYEEVESIRAPNDRTVVVRLRRRFSPFVQYFFGPQGVGAILPEHLLGRYRDLNHVPFNERPVGSGPFRVVQWRHGDRIILAANPYYWRGKPHIERIVYSVIPDPSTRLVRLQTGEATAYFDVDPQLLPQVRSIPGVHVQLTPVNDMHVLRFNLRDPIVSDVRVRRAIAEAIDRSTLLAAATHGSGVIVDADQPKNGWAYDSHVVGIRYNPAASARLLDAAGWYRGAGGVRRRNGEPLDLTLVIAPQAINGSPLVAAILQEDLRKVGIRVTIKQIPLERMYGPASAGGVLASGTYQIAYDAWWVLGSDPDDSWNFACREIPPAGLNYSFWCDRRADAAMRDALATVDRSRRKADYAIVQRAIVRDLPEFTLWQVRMPDAYRTYLLGVTPSPNGSTFYNAWNWRFR